MVYIVLDSETIQIHISSFYDISATILVSYQTIDLQYDTGFNRESWLAKIKYTQKKTIKNRTTKKQHDRKNHQEKKQTKTRNTKNIKKTTQNINQKHGFSSVFFFWYLLYSFFASLVCFFLFCSEFGFFFVLLFKLCKTLHSLCRWTYNTLI